MLAQYMRIKLKRFQESKNRGLIAAIEPKGEFTSFLSAIASFSFCITSQSFVLLWLSFGEGKTSNP